MRRVTAALSGVAVVILAAGVWTQGAPNLSGKWTPDAEKNATVPQAERGTGSALRPMTLKQTEKSFTIERVDSTGPNSITYDFGVPVDVDSSMGKATASAKIIGNTVAIATVPVGGTAGRVIVYAMEGKWLLVTTSLPGRNGGAPTTTKVYFKKG
jgi:hypothetical protein